MTAQKRQCINCRFYEDAHLAASGHCTHPERQSDSTLRLMVRNRELACRNSWGGDLFVSKDGDDASHPDPDPHAPYHEDTPDSEPRHDLVTSVVTPPLTRSPNGTTSGETGEDRVVSDLPAPSPKNRLEADEVDDGKNDPARQDQDERARVIARDPAAAIARARALHLNRKREGYGRDGAPDPVSDDYDPDNDANSTSPSRVTHSGADQVVTQHQRLSHRFTRKMATEARISERDQLVPRSEVENHSGNANTRHDRFDSVPEIDPNFDLPGLRRDSLRDASDTAAPTSVTPETEGGLQAPTSHDPVAIEEDSTTGVPESEPMEVVPAKTLEHVLTRARRIRESKKQSPPHVHRFAVSTSLPEDETTDPLNPDHHPTAHTRANHSDSALPPLADDADDGYSDFRGVELEAAEQDIQNTHTREDHGQVRRSWLARFGINRTPALDDEPHADATEAQHGDAFNDEDASVYADSEPVEQQHGYSAATQWQADTTPEPDKVADNGHARSSKVYGNPETYSVDTYNAARDNVADYLPPATYPHSTSDQQYSHAVLPDIDELFATATVHTSSLVEHDAPVQLDGTRHHRRSTQGFQPEPDRYIVASRWSGDTPYSPRESFFRARRFDNWDEQHPEQWRLDDTPDLTDDRAFHRDESEIDPDKRGASLPDIAADSFDLRDIIERGGELMDMRIDVAPDVPRACRTCRSFRSADGGARGWCTNEWAFTHRRMVNEDDVACKTTIGSWWLPDDRYWMTEDLDYWSDVTPRMDAFMARGTRAPRRKISGE